jgi:hypothetical protein
MVAELNILSEWIPEQMSCPNSGTLGLITRKQLAGLLSVICGSDQCSAQFFINDSDIVIRRPS